MRAFIEIRFSTSDMLRKSRGKNFCGFFFQLFDIYKHILFYDLHEIIYYIFIYLFMHESFLQRTFHQSAHTQENCSFIFITAMHFLNCTESYMQKYE